MEKKEEDPSSQCNAQKTVKLIRTMRLRRNRNLDVHMWSEKCRGRRGTEPLKCLTLTT